jgi:hypothetical protein
VGCLNKNDLEVRGVGASDWQGFLDKYQGSEVDAIGCGGLRMKRRRLGFDGVSPDLISMCTFEKRSGVGETG